MTIVAITLDHILIAGMFGFGGLLTGYLIGRKA